MSGTVGRVRVGVVVLSCVVNLGACGGDDDEGGSSSGSGASGGVPPEASGGTVNSAGSSGAGTGATSSGGKGGAAGSSGGTGSSGASGAESGGTSAGGVGGGGTEDAVDAFGISQLHPSAPGGAEWTSEHWADGDAYSITERIDENDPLGLSGMRGTGTLEVTGDGELVMGGSQPRIYVYPAEKASWQNIEVTVYYQRVDDDATAYAGLVVGVRSGPDGHTTETACDAHTYYARLRHDGAIDFEKELKHPASSTGSRIEPEEVWPPDGALPTGEWIGWKFVIYNLTSSSVALESYRDLTLGQDGGDWQLMNELVDDGGWSVETDCAEHEPVDGESDLIVTAGGAVLVRNTNAVEARYRWMSIREIEAP